MTEVGDGLVTVAVIFSRPELICFVSALEDVGISPCVIGFNFGALPHQVVAMGGYPVLVAGRDVEGVTDLIEEIRVNTEPPVPSRSLRNRLWALIAGYSGVVGLSALFSGNSLALLFLFNVIQIPFPLTLAGDYRSKSGRLTQVK